MTSSQLLRTRMGRAIRMASVATLAAGGLSALSSGARAQEAPVHHRAHRHVVRTAEAPPLTVRRRVYLPADEAEPVDAPGFFRNWNDPSLYSFYGWKLGGDNFYGDQDGDPSTRGNASLGMISGYGPANGGYGGPHFDSVGGFHNGPGPGAQEAADYASGSISRPDYGGIVPHYPSVKARVASLNMGLTAETHTPVSRVAYRAVAPRGAVTTVRPRPSDEESVGTPDEPRDEDTDDDDGF